jgi:hypothetical protein
MKFYEYKRHLINGQLRDPEFVVNGGHWFNSNDYTYVAVAPDVAEYYLPDTLQELTRDQLNSRVLSIHAHNPFMKFNGMPGSGGIQTNTAMSDAEVVNYVTTWISQLG